MGINKLRNWMASIVTILLIVGLFGIVFVQMGLAEPDARFYIELIVISCISICVRFMWYNSSEEKAMVEEEGEIDTYYDRLETDVTDIDDLDLFLVMLTEENRQAYIKQHIGCRTAVNCPKYAKIYHNIELRADRIKPITSVQVMTRGTKATLISARNHKAARKFWYLTLGSVLSVVGSLIIARIAFKDFISSWETLFRYVLYLASIGVSLATSVISGYTITKAEIKDHLARLTFIVDKYCHYKNKKVSNGK